VLDRTPVDNVDTSVEDSVFESVDESVEDSEATSVERLVESLVDSADISVDGKVDESVDSSVLVLVASSSEVDSEHISTPDWRYLVPHSLVSRLYSRRTRLLNYHH
jgi:hypothetical protein